jgi:hypothetical protein
MKYLLTRHNTFRDPVIVYVKMGRWLAEWNISTLVYPTLVEKGNLDGASQSLIKNLLLRKVIDFS